LPQPLRAALRDDNPVVAEVDGVPIRWNAVVRSAASLPPEYLAAFDQVFPVLLARMVDRQLLANEARRRGYAKEAEIAEAVRQYEDELIRRRLVEDYLAEEVTEAEIAVRVDALSGSPAAPASPATPQESVRVRIILTANRNMAQRIEERLRDGADFARLAAAMSLHPSADQGGDLGYQSPAQLFPRSLATALEGLDKGEVATVPQPNGSVYLVKLLDRRSPARRADPAPQAAASGDRAGMRERVRKELSRLKIDLLLGSLRRQARIAFFPDP